MKGIYKGFKYITHIFVVKEEEIQIGLPTDVKHVAHIGIDGPSGSAPSWMNDFKAAPEFSSSLCSSPISESAKSTTRDHASPQEEASERDVVASDIPKVRRKQKRKKTSKSSSAVSSPKASSSPSHVSRSSRPRKSKLKKNSDDGSGDQSLLSIE